MQTTSKDWEGDVFIRLNGEKVICIDTQEWEEGLHVDFVRDNLNLILMQYTGLKDKSGREIYEGDIIENWQGRKSEVKFYDRLGAFEMFDGPEHITQPWEIIGNVYQNPEMLKREE